MRRKIRINRDDANFETVLMRRFHLTPGQPEYVFVKRRVSVKAAEQSPLRGGVMPRADKSKYTEKQRRKTEHIEKGYEERCVPEPTAKKRAWATLNRMDGGGKLSGSGRAKPVNKAPARKGGAASAARSTQSKSELPRKAARMRSDLKTRLRPSAIS